MSNICIELSYCYVKGELKKLVDERRKTHIFSSYSCPVIPVNESELVKIEKLCRDNNCRLSFVE